MHRFFVSPDDIHANEIYFSAPMSHQISRVLRLRSGDRIIILDGSGVEILTELITVNEMGCVGSIIQREECRNEPRTYLLMILSLTQREKFEWMLQKCTEIGASAFIPVITDRSLVQDLSGVASKYPRWKTILKEAAEQSGRGIVPKLLEPGVFNEMVKRIPQEYPMCLIPWEDEHQITLDDLLQNQREGRIAVMIGPEGGFSETEVELAARFGFKPVTLGKRILRMETAALVAAALVLHETEKD